METNEVLFETWQAILVQKLNKSKYYAQPIINYLSSLSQSNGKWGRDEIKYEIPKQPKKPAKSEIFIP